MSLHFLEAQASRFTEQVTGDDGGYPRHLEH